MNKARSNSNFLCCLSNQGNFKLLKQGKNVTSISAESWNINHQNWRCFTIAEKKEYQIAQYEYLGTMAVWERLLTDSQRIQRQIPIFLDNVYDYVCVNEYTNGELTPISGDLLEDILFTQGNNVQYGGFYNLEALSVFCKMLNTQAQEYRYCVASTNHQSLLNEYGDHAIRSWLEANRSFFTGIYDRFLLRLPDSHHQKSSLWRFNGLYLNQDTDPIYKHFSSLEEACKWENSTARPRGEKRYHCVVLTEEEAVELNRYGAKAIQQFMEDHHHAFLYMHERNLPLSDFTYPEGPIRGCDGRFVNHPKRAFQ